jgi:hypothetical protein
MGAFVRGHAHELSGRKSISYVLREGAVEIGKHFEQHGFAKFSLLKPEEFSVVEEFAVRWVATLLGEKPPSFSAYHLWSQERRVRHEEIFAAKSRHAIPPPSIQAALLKSALFEALGEVGIRRPVLWDEGLGWLAFRIIRPSWGDGYPLSRKSWGIAKGVYSVYLPVVGFESSESPGFVSGSHRKEYPFYSPPSTKFCREEYRLAENVSVDLTRPCFRKGEALLYHPETLHTEETEGTGGTRISLEFRFREGT